jgi:hypothetical protein
MARKKKRAGFNWTKEKEEVFFEVLGDTANISEAGRAIGLKPADTAAHRRRGKDPAFAARWELAKDAAYEKLELLLIERGLGGGEPVPDSESKLGERTREIPTQLALQLLRLRDGRRGKGGPAASAPVRSASASDWSQMTPRRLRAMLEGELSEINRRLRAKG